MTDKHAILNVTKIIDMLDEAKCWLWTDTEQTSFILSDLMDILEKSDGLEMQLAK